MKPRRASLLALITVAAMALNAPGAALAQTNDADADAVAGFESAGAVLRRCRETSSYSRNYCFAYLAAVADAARSYRIWIGSGDPCLPANLTLGRIADTFEAYLVNNPSLTKAQAASVIVASLQENFPCSPPPAQMQLPVPVQTPAQATVQVPAQSSPPVPQSEQRAADEIDRNPQQDGRP